MELRDIRGKKILVVGSGISGTGAVKALRHVEAEPILFDENDKLDPKEVRAKFAPEENVQVVLGELPKEIEESVSLVILSPWARPD